MEIAIADEFLGVKWETEDTVLPPPDGCCIITKGGIETDAWPCLTAFAVGWSSSKNPTYGIVRLDSWPSIDVSIGMGGRSGMELSWPLTIIPWLLF